MHMVFTATEFGNGKKVLFPDTTLAQYKYSSKNHRLLTIPPVLHTTVYALRVQLCATILEGRQ